MKDVIDYCRGLEAELTAWKAKVYNIVRRIDKMSSGDKAKVADQVADLHMLIEELDDRIDRLRRECPTEWGADKIEIEQILNGKTSGNYLSHKSCPDIYFIS